MSFTTATDAAIDYPTTVAVVTKIHYYFHSSDDITDAVVSTRDPLQDALEAPERAIGFFYYDIVEVAVIIGDEKVLAESSMRNRSHVYHINGRYMSVDEIILEMDASYGPMIEEMQMLRISHKVLCKPVIPGWPGRFENCSYGVDEIITTTRQEA